MTETEFYAQFRGDGVEPAREDYIAVCRANGKHEWYMLYGGAQCRQCGVQVAAHTEHLYDAFVISEMKRLDAELRTS